jgi:conjugal transfer pilus assembly protein TraW
MQITKLITVLIFIFAVFPVQAKDLGSVGRTYPIAEKDALTEIEGRARSIDWQKLYAKARPENYRPENLKDLPRVERAKSFLVDMTYTLQTDIPDGKGGILYPAGYSFNPLDYVVFKKTLVVIDGADREQVSWFSRSKFMGQPETMLLITAGSSTDLQNHLKRPVFYATQPIIQRFNLVAVPSVIRRKDRAMEVVEIFLSHHSQDKLTEVREK